MQESRRCVGLPCNVLKRRALDTKESRSRFGLSRVVPRGVLASCPSKTSCPSMRPRDSCRTHASATRLLDLVAWARLPDPPVRICLHCLPAWL
eukprot:6770013-Pyramimonas_sp.AAC.1